MRCVFSWPCAAPCTEIRRFCEIVFFPLPDASGSAASSETALVPSMPRTGTATPLPAGMAPMTPFGASPAAGQQQLANWFAGAGAGGPSEPQMPMSGDLQSLMQAMAFEMDTQNSAGRSTHVQGMAMMNTTVNQAGAGRGTPINPFGGLPAFRPL